MSQKHALIIEDNREIAEVYALTLQMLNYDTQIVLDGKSALDEIDAINPPDLLVLDMNLPQVSGHYIYKQLRGDADWENTPIIICTANHLVAEALAKELTGSDRILMKPVSPKELKALVEML